MPYFGLNERAHLLVEQAIQDPTRLRVSVQRSAAGACIIDCGIGQPGGIDTGLLLARVCLADLASVSLSPGDVEGIACPTVQVQTDHPVTACMASQYAGWQVSAGKFFAMGSGPMRAALGTEELFNHIAGREKAPLAVGVLETRKLPSDEAIAWMSDRLKLPAERLTLLVAPTASIAGTVQVVARALETAMHKLHELKFDLTQVVSGYGAAPLPPVAHNDLEGIGRTNDAVLYGGRVILWVRGDDAQLAEIGPRVPSSSSAAHGAPFAEIFEKAGRDFYKIDPLLFSPAELVFHNLTTGRTHSFGRCESAVLRRSFYGVGK